LNQDVINCPRCARRTAAARGTCIYCGETLPVVEIQAAPPQRNIDSSELAFNTILEPVDAPASEAVTAALVSALGVETAEAESYIASHKRVPVARSQTSQEASMIAALVRNCGLNAVVIPDEDLMLESEQTRARRIVPGEDGLEVHHPGGSMLVPFSEIRLLVVGALSSSRVDYTEGVRGQSGSVLDMAEYRADETLLDVYTTSLDRSFRIKSDAFDYSGLVTPLSFQADVNFQAAVAALEKAAPQAIFDNDFSRIRNLLARVWPARSRNEAHGIKRQGLTYRPVAQASVISDNRNQFERYSRLMFASLKRR
jgi:hypothetical protein